MSASWEHLETMEESEVVAFLQSVDPTDKLLLNNAESIKVYCD
jgi:hypothetical protein